MTKALFLDIDGTLVSFRTHRIPASTLEALTDAKARGIRIFIATGRPRILINNLMPLEERGLIDGFITMNGAYCFVGEEVIYKSHIPANEAETLLRFCAGRNIPCIVVGEHRICVCQPGQQVDDVFRKQLGVTAEVTTTTVEEALAQGETFQMTPFLDEENEHTVAPHIPHCEIGRWHPAFVDITAKGNTKQRGMDEIIRHFGIDLKDTMAFGDGGNDIPMLRHAAIGIAMGNARDSVKEVADYVTDSVDEDGIAKAMEKHLFNEE